LFGLFVLLAAGDSAGMNSSPLEPLSLGPPCRRHGYIALVQTSDYLSSLGKVKYLSEYK